MASRALESQELKSLKRSTSALRSAFTKNVNALTKLAESASPGSPSLLTTLIEEAQVKLTHSFDNLTTAIVRLMDVDEATDATSTWDSKLQSCTAEYNDVTQKVLRALTIIPSPVQHPTSPTLPNTQNLPARRLEDTLKPSTLSLDMTPAELTLWIASLQAWYEFNNMQGLTIPQQHRFLYNILDSHLSSNLERRVHSDTPVFSNDDTESCVSILQDFFHLRYPLIQRRAQYFGHTQGNQQRFTDFLYNLQKLGAEADLHMLNVNDIHCFRAIVGTTDLQLRQRLLKLSPLTLDAIEREACAYEMAKEVGKSLDNPAERAAHLKTGQKSPRSHQHQSGQNQSGQNQSYRRAKLQQFRGKCLRCGSPKHTSNCPKTNLQCNKCNKSGHTGYVCLSNPQPKTASQHQAHQQSKQASPPRSPNRGQSPERQHRASAPAVVKNTASANEVPPKLQLCFS